MRELPQGTVTLLFTDIEGSTRLLHALGPERYAEALAEHRRIVRDAISLVYERDPRVVTIVGPGGTGKMRFSIELARLLEHMMAVAAWRREDWDRMRGLTEHALVLARDRFGFLETTGYWLSGQLALHDGDMEGAVDFTRRSAEMAREAGWAWWESGQRHELLVLALLRGDLDEAEREGQVALEMERTQENRLWALYTLAGLAQVALARGELEEAAFSGAVPRRRARLSPAGPRNASGEAALWSRNGGRRSRPRANAGMRSISGTQSRSRSQPRCEDDAR